MCNCKPGYKCPTYTRLDDQRHTERTVNFQAPKYTEPRKNNVIHVDFRRKKAV